MGFGPSALPRSPARGRGLHNISKVSRSVDDRVLEGPVVGVQRFPARLLSPSADPHPSMLVGYSFDTSAADPVRLSDVPATQANAADPRTPVPADDAVQMIEPKMMNLKVGTDSLSVTTPSPHTDTRRTSEDTKESTSHGLPHQVPDSSADASHFQARSGFPMTDADEHFMSVVELGASSPTNIHHHGHSSHLSGHIPGLHHFHTHDDHIPLPSIKSYK